MIVNHVGLRVTDIETSTRFYEALGFVEALGIDVPDQPADRLLRLSAPLGLRAVYLTNGSFVLELIGLESHDPTPRPMRAMSDVGLTHLSIGVDDLGHAKDVVAAQGGAVLDDTDIGVAVMVRDPDGQLIELLDVAYRPVTPSD